MGRLTHWPPSTFAKFSLFVTDQSKSAQLVIRFVGRFMLLLSHDLQSTMLWKKRPNNSFSATVANYIHQCKHRKLETRPTQARQVYGRAREGKACVWSGVAMASCTVGPHKSEAKCSTNTRRESNLYLTEMGLLLAAKQKILHYWYSNKKRKQKINIKLDDLNIKKLESARFLGVRIDRNLDWKHQISYICNKIDKTTGILCRARRYLPRVVMRGLY